MLRDVHHNTNKGFTQMIAIILVSLVGMSIALALLPLGAAAVREASAAKYFLTAKANAEACADLALHKLYGDALYSGIEAYDSGGIDCSAETDNTALPDDEHGFVIQTTGFSDEYTRRISVSGVIASGTSPVISAWEEVEDF